MTPWTCAAAAAAFLGSAAAAAAQQPLAGGPYPGGMWITREQSVNDMMKINRDLEAILKGTDQGVGVGAGASGSSVPGGMRDDQLMVGPGRPDWCNDFPDSELCRDDAQ